MLEPLFDDDSSEDDNSFCEQVLSQKEISIRKIEFALADVNDQLQRNDTKPVLRISYDSSRHSLTYTGRDAAEKLRKDVYCLQQILNLLLNDKKSTKRELYYENVALYKNQNTTDRCIQRMCQLLDEPRANLNIMSCSKGILRGAISFLSSDVGIIDAKCQDVLISESLMSCRIINDSEFILVVEKEAAYQKLIDQGFFNIFPNSILLTGKGYPDICTRNVIKHVVNSHQVPIFGLFDADPHGIEIFLTYKYGSVNDHAEGRGALIPSIQWIGLFPSDSQRLSVPLNQYLQLSTRDHSKIRSLLQRATLLGEVLIAHELNLLLQIGHKIELESTNHSDDNLLILIVIRPRIMHLLGTF